MKYLRLFFMLVLPVVLVLSSCTKEELLTESEETQIDESALRLAPSTEDVNRAASPDLIITRVGSTLPPNGPCPVLVGQPQLQNGTGNVTFDVRFAVQNRSSVAIPAGTNVAVTFKFSGLNTVYTIPNTQGYAPGEIKTYSTSATLTAATGSPIGLGARSVQAVVDRANVVAEFNENNNSNNGYKFCDDF